MKTNKILLFSLAAAMMASCADDEFTTNNGINGNEGVSGKLVEAGLLGVGLNEGNADTRAYNPEGKFVWMPAALENDGSLTTNRLNAKIGLCWTGVANDGFGAVETADQKVYTNYEYEHVGWLDVKAKSPKADPCDAKLLVNGAYIKGEGKPEANFEGIAYTGGRWNKYYDTKTTGKYSSNSEWADREEEYSGDLDLARGIFSTKNASVFEGEYLAYYPYTNAFTKGQIVANEPTTFTVDQTADRYAAASDVAFSIGYIDNYVGGNAASGISAKTLSGFLIAKLYNYAAAKAPEAKNIKTVIFYSEEQGILYKQDLNAKACVDALKAGDLGAGTNLYYTANPLFHETTNAIVANLCKTGENPVENFAVEGVEDEPTTADDYAWVALPVLPQNISDLKVILIDTDDKSCELSMPTGAVAPNKALIKEINLAECEFIPEYLVVDEASFLSAMNKIKENGATGTTEDANKVKLLKDITLTFDAAKNPAIEPYVGSGKYTGEYNSLFFDKNIKIYSACGAKLTVAADTKMHIKNLATAVVTSATPVLTIDVPVVIEGAGCCGDKVGKLSIGGAQSIAQPCTVVMTKNVENYGTLVLGNNAKGNTEVTIKGTLTNKYDTDAVNRLKTRDAATVYLVGGHTSGTSDITIQKVINENEVYSRATAVDIWTGNDVQWFANNNVTADKRIVTATITTLENKGLVEIGDRTLINVNTSLQNEIAVSVIDIIGDGHSATDGRLDVKGTSANEGTVDNKGVVNFTGSSLDNNGLFIDQLSGQVGGKLVDNGTATGTTTKVYGDKTYSTDLGKAGIYVSQVATVDRMAFTLSDVVEEPSTVIIEILGCDEQFYNLEDFEKNMENKDVYINADKQIAFKSFNAEGVTESCFGHCVTVLANNTLLVTDGTLKTIKDVKVEKEGIFNVRASKDGKEVKVTIGQDLINEGTTNHTAQLLTVNNDLKNTGKFKSDSAFVVINDVTTSGSGSEFDSNGTPNSVKGNFTQDGGEVTFAMKTTTQIDGTFACQAGKFEREGLNGGIQYRATVNVGELGATNGTTSTAWPTQYK